MRQLGAREAAEEATCRVGTSPGDGAQQARADEERCVTVGPVERPSEPERQLPPSSTRCASSTPTFAGKRRSANASESAEAESSHRTSSMASSTALFSAQAASTLTKPVAVVRAEVPSTVFVPNQSAGERALLDLRKGRSHFIERPDEQIREGNEHQLLFALGGPRLESPHPPSSARRTPSSHRVVFPIPA